MSTERGTARGIDAAVVAAWEAALVEYSGALDEHRSFLLAIEADDDAEHDSGHDGSLAQPVFVPPADLEPLPEALLPWARQLLEQTNGLVQLAGELAERSERALAARTPNHRHRLVAADSAASTWDALL
jgi:hypothetical protein